eukprot:GHVT01066007.1.p1 GENE.GHVT01066007.1~~GHVT01066007.1.p1  ORF type:complete len:347 (+),score=11.09 GHVT01066007.1:4128-5168(+)
MFRRFLQANNPQWSSHIHLRASSMWFVLSFPAMHKSSDTEESALTPAHIVKDSTQTWRLLWVAHPSFLELMELLWVLRPRRLHAVCDAQWTNQRVDVLKELLCVARTQRPRKRQLGVKAAQASPSPMEEKICVIKRKVHASGASASYRAVDDDKRHYRSKHDAHKSPSVRDPSCKAVTVLDSATVAPFDTVPLKWDPFNVSNFTEKQSHQRDCQPKMRVDCHPKSSSKSESRRAQERSEPSQAVWNGDTCVHSFNRYHGSRLTAPPENAAVGCTSVRDPWDIGFGEDRAAVDPRGWKGASHYSVVYKCRDFVAWHWHMGTYYMPCEACRAIKNESESTKIHFFRNR